MKNTADTIPADITLERHVLGILLVHGAEALVSVQHLVMPENFYTPAHAQLVAALLAMLQEGKPITPVTIVVELRHNGILDKIGQDPTEAGGIDYITQLAEYSGFDITNLRYNAEELHKLAMLRSMISTGAKMTSDAKAPGADAFELVERFTTELYDLHRGRTGGPGEVVGAGEAVKAAIARADRIAAGEESPGLASGFAAIDRATGGMQPGDLWTLGAATSIGKTALAHSMAVHVARNGGAVFIVSAEMGRESVANRLLQAVSGVSGGRLRTGNLNEQELEARQVAAEEIAAWHLAIFDRSATAPEIAIRAKMLAARWRRGLSLIVVDYLQLMKPTAGDNRAQQVGGIAWGLKQAAMDLGCPVLMLSQLNRAGVKPGIADDERPPSLFDLKESGDVENHSNAVLLLHRSARAVPDTAGAMPVWCKVAKARDGMVTPWPAAAGKPPMPGSITLRFRPELTRFECTQVQGPQGNLSTLG